MNALRAGLACLFMAVVSTTHAYAASPGDILRAQVAAAEPGATITISAGEYDGPFVIAKPLRLIGEPGAVLRGDRLTHVIAVRAPDVEIAGLTIRDSGTNLSGDHAAIHITGARAFVHDNHIRDSLHGVYVRKADGCRIERNVIHGQGHHHEGETPATSPASSPPAKIADPFTTGGPRPSGAIGGGGAEEICAPGEGLGGNANGLGQDRRGNGIHLWNSADHLIVGNVISGTRDGVYFSFTDRTTVRGNTFSHVRYGLHYMYSDDNTFEGNLFTENAAGAALMFSRGIVLRENRFIANRSHRAYGLLLQSVDDTRIENNEISGNTLGLYLENTNNCVVAGNTLAQNYVALRVTDSSSGGRFFENALVGNLHPVETSGANASNTWTEAGRGNFWDGAARFDLDRNGIADVPHHEADLFGPWRRGFPVVALLSASPGERLLRFVHARLALPGVAGVTDPHPLVTTGGDASGDHSHSRIAKARTP